MPSSKVPCLWCPTRVAKTNVTHLCRACYLVSRRRVKDPPFSVVVGPIHFPTKTPPPSKTPIRVAQKSRRSRTRTPRMAVIQPRQYSHQPNFFDLLPQDLLIYTSTYLQLDLHSYLIDDHYANLVKRVYADLGQLICVISRVFPLSDKTYTLVCKMQNSVDQIRGIFDNYVCGVEESLLKKPPTQYYYGRDPDLTLGAHPQPWSRIDYTTLERPGRKKSRTFPEEIRPQIRETIADLQTMNQIIVGFKKAEVERLSKSGTKGVLKIIPKYLRHCEEWLTRMDPYIHPVPNSSGWIGPPSQSSVGATENKQIPVQPDECRSTAPPVKIKITPATNRPISEYSVDHILAIDAPYVLPQLSSHPTVDQVFDRHRGPFEEMLRRSFTMDGLTEEQYLDRIFTRLGHPPKPRIS